MRRTRDSSVELAKIHELVLEKEEEMNKQKFNKYFPVFKIAINFFKQQPVLLYGGTALNELMPSKLKFYPPYTLPDIDVLCVGAKKVAKALVQVYRQHGFDTAASGPALHPGTMKVFAGGLQVADVTEVSKAGFNKLTEGSRNSSMGIRIANPRFLLSTLYQQLSQPLDANRWEKVYARLVAAHQVFPPQKCFPSFTQTRVPTQTLEPILGWLCKTPHVLVGAHAYLMLAVEAGLDQYNGHVGSLMPKGTTLLDVLVEKNLEKAAKECIDALTRHGIPKTSLSVSAVFPADDFITDHIIISFEKEPLVGLFKAPACNSYNTHHGVNVGSIHTLMHMFMACTFSKYNHLRLQNNDCMGNMLAWILDTVVPTARKKNLLKPLVLQCYGHQDGLVTMRRNHFGKASTKKRST